FPHFAGQPGRVERKYRITASCENNVTLFIGKVQRIFQQPGAAAALQQMHVVDDQRNGPET
ncbi:MAG TPA: hypothetical protein VFM91_06805, partial [Propionibacteriaceae bacterium]|nr:hypothetical protein [Propionibacteriaceae bacterium]